MTPLQRIKHMAENDPQPPLAFYQGEERGLVKVWPREDTDAA